MKREAARSREGKDYIVLAIKTCTCLLFLESTCEREGNFSERFLRSHIIRARAAQKCFPSRHRSTKHGSPEFSARYCQQSRPFGRPIVCRQLWRGVHSYNMDLARKMITPRDQHARVAIPIHSACVWNIVVSHCHLLLFSRNSSVAQACLVTAKTRCSAF